MKLRCLAGLALLLAGVLSASAATAADSPEPVLNLISAQPLPPSTDCGAFSESPATALRNVTVPAPAQGWTGEPIAVTVGNAPSGPVRIQMGARSACGEFGDSRSMDTRFRAAVGAVFVPVAGSRQPIEISYHPSISPLWLPVVGIGHPEDVQRQDTLRFAIRVATFAVTLAIVVSTLLAFFVVRERRFLVFAAATLLLSLWIALVGGVSGFPSPWLPTGELRIRLVAALPVMALALCLHLLLEATGAERRLRWAHRAATLVSAALVSLAIAALLLPHIWLPPVAGAIEWLALGAFVLLIGSALYALVRGARVNLAGLMALLPFALIGSIGALAPALLATWKTELVIVSAAWISVATSAVLMLRLGALREQRDALRELAETDALTGLANRRAALIALEHHVGSHHQNGRDFSLVFVDIDHFKAINDRYGHAVGDQVLVQVGRLLRGMLRSTDMVARLGGEEFLLLLPGAGLEAARRLATRARQVIEEGVLIGQATHLNLSASLGIASLQQFPEANATDLLRHADHAMYEAKRSGRNRVAVAEVGRREAVVVETEAE